MSCFEVLVCLKSFFKKQPSLQQELAVLYKRRFQNTIFYEVCKSSLRYISQQSEQQSELFQEESHPFQNQSTRKFHSSNSHYEDANLNFSEHFSHSDLSSSWGKGNQSIPKSLSYMSINQKQSLLKQLIEKSYLFVDLSDLFSEEDLEVYESIIKQEIFNEEESIMGSILQNYQKKAVKDRLKNFDSEALHLLKTYVNFCTEITEKLRPISVENQAPVKTIFLPRLILQLKARLQMQFPEEKLSGKVSQLNRLVSEYRVMNDIILRTLQKTERIHIIPEQSHEYAENFFTYPNISTLVSVILFMDENFLKAIFERFMQGLKMSVGRLGEKLNMVQKSFIEEIKFTYFGLSTKSLLEPRRLSTNELFTYKSNYQKIIEGDQEIDFPYFTKSLRKLETLKNQKQPIKTLKIIYELNKTIEEEHTELINKLIDLENQSQKKSGVRGSYQQMRNSQRTKKYSFSRQTQYLIIEFLLSRKKDKLRFIVTNIMITYYFVNANQLKDKKGSCLAPFVDIIKKKGIGLQ